MDKENYFRVDDVGQINLLKQQEKDIAFFMIVTEIERIRKELGHYIWVFPVKWRDENGNTYANSLRGGNTIK